MTDAGLILINFLKKRMIEGIIYKRISILRNRAGLSGRPAPLGLWLKSHIEFTKLLCYNVKAEPIIKYIQRMKC